MSKPVKFNSLGDLIKHLGQDPSFRVTFKPLSGGRYRVNCLKHRTIVRNTKNFRRFVINNAHALRQGGSSQLVQDRLRTFEEPQRSSSRGTSFYEQRRSSVSSFWFP